MPNVEPTSKITASKEEDFDELSKQLDKQYENLANGINSKTDTIVRKVAPAATDYRFDIGTHWIDSTANKVYVLTSRPTVVTATWTEVS